MSVVIRLARAGTRCEGSTGDFSVGTKRGSRMTHPNSKTYNNNTYDLGLSMKTER